MRIYLLINISLAVSSENTKQSYLSRVRCLMLKYIGILKQENEKIGQLIYHSSCLYVNSRPAETMYFLVALGQVNDDEQGIDIFLIDMR